MIRLSHRAPAPAAARVSLATRTVRKIALCGSHSNSLVDAPWDDPSWEWWGHSSSRAWYRRPMDRYFDLHPKACWTGGGKKGDGYPKWLAKNTTPIYMQKHFDEVPASVEYPKGRVLTEFGDVRPYFTNHAAWMVALALTEGVSVIGFYGINYSSDGEYARQRGSAEYWIGRAAERGVRIVLPSQNTLLAEPGLLYGYESHDEETGRLKAEYKPQPAKDLRPVTQTPGKPFEFPTEILKKIEAEEQEYPRPDWAQGETTPRIQAVG